jgi:hypothetical protein
VAAGVMPVHPRNPTRIRLRPGRSIPRKRGFLLEFGAP